MTFLHLQTSLFSIYHFAVIRSAKVEMNSYNFCLVLSVNLFQVVYGIPEETYYVYWQNNNAVFSFIIHRTKEALPYHHLRGMLLVTQSKKNYLKVEVNLYTIIQHSYIVVQIFHNFSEFPKCYVSFCHQFVSFFCLSFSQKMFTEITGSTCKIKILF